MLQDGNSWDTQFTATNNAVKSEVASFLNLFQLFQTCDESNEETGNGLSWCAIKQKYSSSINVYENISSKQVFHVMQKQK